MKDGLNLPLINEVGKTIFRPTFFQEERKGNHAAL